MTAYRGALRQVLRVACVLTLGTGPMPAGWGQPSPERVAAADMVFAALGLVGAPYRYGGSDPSAGLDCSGLVYFVAREALGLHLPRQAEAMGRLGTPVDRQALQPGDLVFFNTLGRPFSHVGVYLGDGQFVHAPTRGGEVRVESMAQRYWARRFNGARRLLALVAEPSELKPVVRPTTNSTGTDDPFGLDKP